MEPVIAIVGPTASGKTALSVALAGEIGGEVISMDSRQVYRGMDIGTAKASAEQRALVPHHGLDLVDPDQRFSAAAWAAMARQLIGQTTERGNVPLLVGGTGFYLRALTHPMFAEPEMDPARRERLRAWLAPQEAGQLRRWLELLDPTTAARLAAGGGRQRVIRALELPLLTGRRLSALQEDAAADEAPLQPLVFVLSPARDRLRAAIDDRVTRMADEGLEQEVARLLAAGYRPDHPGLNATGYAELIPVLTRGAPLPEALDRVRANTRAYARRQLTWFRHQLPAGAIWLDGEQPLDHLVPQIVSAWREARRPRSPDVDGTLS